MEKSPYKKLVSNSIAFTIANLGSKVISFVLVPVYTYVLSTEEYGTIDIMLTLNSLLMPFIFLSISDAVLRYAMDKRYDKRDVLSVAAQIYLFGMLILLCVLPIIGFYNPEIKEYLLLFGLVLLLNGLMQMCNQFLRASNHVKAFAANGVIYTLIFAGMNIMSLVVLRLGIYGYLYSMLFADMCCVIFAVVIARMWRYLCYNPSRSVLKAMLRYSIPLIPNALMWWIMDASDKFVIAYFLGVGANGLYAISKKLPTLIDTFHGIFNQAWQISAIQESNVENAKDFTSKVYEIYFVFIFLVVNSLMIVAKPLVMYILSNSYYESWKYIPFLLVSVGFSSLSGFLSSKLIAMEKSISIFVTTVTGAVINTVLNFLLIPFMGINGAAIATLLGFGVVLIVREQMLKAKDCIEIRFNRGMILLLTVLQIIAYYAMEVEMSVICMSLLLILYIWQNKRTMLQVVKPIVERLRN